MVYYARFLKPPRIQAQKAGPCTVSALVCITTDLGDSFLSQTVTLLVTLAGPERTEDPLYQAQETVLWHSGKRELHLSLGPFPLHFLKRNLVLGISAVPSGPHAPSSADNLQDRSSVPLIISGWSTPFGKSQSLVADKLIERRLHLKDGLDVRVWEETGNSIARHIW